MYSHRTITNLSEFPDLQVCWQRLSNLDPKSTIFSSYAWSESWIKHYWSSDYQLNVVVINFNEQPVAILPLYINLKRKVLMFLASGELERGEISSEYLDFIVDANSEQLEEIYRLIADCLTSLRVSAMEFVNCIQDSHVFPTSALLPRTSYIISGFQFKVDLATLTNSDGIGSSSRQRKNNRQLANRFKNIEELTADVLSEENYQQHWAELKELHQQDWESRGKPGALASQEFNNFHQYMHEVYPEVPQYFSVLAFDKQVISVHHYYKFKNSLYFYLTGTVKNSHSRLSPGMMLHVICMSSLLGNNVYYDFMKAGKEARTYKEKFCEKGDEFYSITIYKNNLHGSFLRLISWLRKLKVRLKAF